MPISLSLLLRCLFLAGLFGLASSAVAAPNALPSVALFYGDNPPWDELRAFDVVVVDPDNVSSGDAGTDVRAHQYADSAVFAYASVGEAHPSKPYFPRIPRAWQLATNKSWGSQVIDQAAPEWPAFFVEQVLAPLWAQGYRGFFLDTLDSYQLVAKSPAASAAQQAGLVAVIRAIKTRWPEARLIANRGFELLPQVHDQLWMMAAESLFQGAAQGRYSEVSAGNRAWLLNQLKTARDTYHLPVLAIDYVAPENRELARKTAAKIRDLGFIPWVSSADLDSLGVGAVEVLPRKVLVLYNPAESPDLHLSQVQRFLSMPLAYLGLVMDYRPVTAAPPAFSAVGRYVGVVSWVNDDNVLTGTGWPQWLQAQTAAGVPLAVFSRFGVGTESPLLGALGMSYVDTNTPATLSIAHADPMMGFELPLRARPQDFYPLQARDTGHPLLTLATPEGRHFQAAAITPWGGYVLAPYVVESLPGKDTGERWYINPLAFLRAALRIDSSVPVPDVTTENGRRLFFSHIDGDGFASLAERAGEIYASEVLRDEVLRRYRLPTTMSVIEGEIGAAGLYPALSPRLERVARDIFALPEVELASHSYSHPFVWRSAEAAKDIRDGEYNLPIKGYRFNTEREVLGSINYINDRLAPAGKRVKVMLWPGDCIATPAALAATRKAGVLNMNGGDTVITKTLNSWTQIAGLGLEKGGFYQVFAPNQNENVYTNLWHGPFYGFNRVIETYEMTDKPYRFKPVNVYYHVYLVSKSAGLASLQGIYAWAQTQSLHPIFSSDYLHKVADFNRMVVARTADGFRVRGQGDLRTVRVSAPDKRALNFQASTGLVGMSPAPEGRYWHLAGASADLVMGSAGTVKAAPYLAYANARTGDFVRHGRDISFGLSGHVPLEFAVGNAESCQVLAAGREVKPVSSSAGLRYFHLDQHAESALKLHCPP